MLVILGFRAIYLLGKINFYNMEKEREIYMLMLNILYVE